MAAKSARLFCLLALLLWGCDGTLVTKNMYKPRVMNLEAIGDPGKDVVKQLNLADSTAPLPPIVAIPGIGGSQLSAKLTKKQSSRWFCQDSEDWYKIWLSLSELLPGPTIECWSNNFVLNYNNITGVFSNVTGVDIFAPNFGSTVGFEYVDPDVPSQTIYFASLVASLVKVGYVKGQNLLGAPYDWRLSPDYQAKFMEELRKMIEDAYAVNQTKVAVIAHSMGNLFFMTFLRTVSQEWKDQYLLTYIATSPPWVGAGVAVQALASGYDFSIPFLLPSEAKVVQRTLASNYFLLPYPEFYQNQILVSTPSKNYTSQNYQELFEALGISAMYDVWNKTLALVNPFEPPGVDTYCLYGYNITTVKGEVFSTDDMTSQPRMVMGDGDGTVNIESLNFCSNWVGKTDKRLMIKGYQGQEHVNLLIHPPFIADVLHAILNTTVSSA